MHKIQQWNVLYHEWQISTHNLNDVLMAMNWVKLYTSWEVMAGQLGCIEPDIAKRVKAVTTKIQSL